jgi:Leu/Phe-tRNA-protein transferase
MYSFTSHYRTSRDGPAVSAWAIASLAGGLLGVLIVGLLVVIARAVRRTTENAAALMGALEELGGTTAALGDLEAQSRHASDVVAEATAVLREYQPRQPEDGDDPDGT